ncbi:MAG: DUF262 domain-containing protein [Chloroflexi bacterium]|nr:DUF262 domain-containing protein [Chloroflexota bacterium]MYK62400.1 DUF262 domain-containing protein [Chloroflexota bacterium]
MYQAPATIKETLDSMHRHDLVLPAIQREFVWRPGQICRLFDSIMQGYPFGTFLYWRVNPENSGRFKFFDFVRDYHQRDSPHCPPLPDMPNKQVTAVLDGQQRLTALNVGLSGSIARKLPYKWWKSPDAFPQRRLYLDLLWKEHDEDEEGIKYRFEFLTEGRSKASSDDECWFPVGEILSMADAGPSMTKWLNERLTQERVFEAHEKLYKLYQVVHSEPLVAYYEEKGQELDKALQIFIRMNDGGTPLSHSDLLLSIAVAQWKDHDARQEIHSLVDELNNIGSGFGFSKDLVLKGGLMLSDIGSVGFKVDNFNRVNMDTFERNWNDIRRALTLTTQLIATFGFNGQNLTAHNAILPIAYYLYRKNPGEGFLSQRRFHGDRGRIRDWLIKSLLKGGVWGSGLDTLLTELRRAINEGGFDNFPADQIREAMARRGRSLTFEDEEIEELADMRYGNRLTFALLSLVFPFVDMSNQFHVDHIFPSARFTPRRLKTADVPEEKVASYRDRKDGLANLQLLQGTQNHEKSARLPDEWLRSAIPDHQARQSYVEIHLLGGLPKTIAEFGEFHESRRTKLKGKIRALLGRP